MRSVIYMKDGLKVVRRRSVAVGAKLPVVGLSLRLHHPYFTFDVKTRNPTCLLWQSAKRTMTDRASSIRRSKT